MKRKYFSKQSFRNVQRHVKCQNLKIKTESTHAEIMNADWLIRFKWVFQISRILSSRIIFNRKTLYFIEGLVKTRTIASIENNISNINIQNYQHQPESRMGKVMCVPYQLHLDEDI